MTIAPVITGRSGSARLSAGALLAATALAACGDADPAASGGGSVGDCRHVPPRVAEVLERRMSGGAGSGLRALRATASEDFPGIFYLSADVQGPGLRGAEDIATWVATGEADPRRILSAEPLATQASDWPASGREHVRGGDEGYEISRECARAAL